MNFFIPALEVGDDDGFTTENDIFGRAKTGEALTNLVSTVTDPLVIAIDGQWGSGKSVFLKMWAGELRKKDIPVIYFDAFENDYLDDAFMAIAGEIIALAQEKNDDTLKTKEVFINAAKKTLPIFLRSAAKIAVKAATLGVLEAADFKPDATAANDSATEASNAFDKYIGERLTQTKAEKATIQQFKEALSELPKFLSQSNSQEENSKPLVIIIDELDRCRPNFALEILERMKHFFSVPNVHFVMGVHMEQLCNSVKFAYGTDTDALTYLQKFINLSLELEKFNSGYEHSNLKKYIFYLQNKLHINRTSALNSDQCVDFIIYISEINNYSFRDVEKILFTLKLHINYKNFHWSGYTKIIAGICILKIKYPELYQKAKSNKLDYNDLKDIFYSKNDREYESYIAQWQDCTDRATNPEIDKKYKELLFGHHGLDRFGIVPAICKEMFESFNVKIN